MALICLDAENPKSSQALELALNDALVELAGVRTRAAVTARDVASAPFFLPVVLRVVSGLAAGFWLVQMVKMYVGA